MKKTLLPIVVVLALATFVSCHRRDMDRDHDHGGGGHFGARPHWNCSNLAEVQRKPLHPGSSTDDSCESDWDVAYYAAHPGYPTQSHQEIGFGATMKDAHGKPRHDKLQFSHSQGLDFSYCVRPVLPSQPMGRGPPQSCTPAPAPVDPACNLYPFENANTGDPHATDFKPVHQFKLLDVATQNHDCHYKLTFFIKDKTGQITVIDPHIVVGGGL